MSQRFKHNLSFQYMFGWRELRGPKVTTGNHSLLPSFFFFFSYDTMFSQPKQIRVRPLHFLIQSLVSTSPRCPSPCLADSDELRAPALEGEKNREGETS